MNKEVHDGRVYSYTTVYGQVIPAGFEEFSPYVIGIIELENGVRLTAQLTDLEKKSVKVKKFVDVGGGKNIEIETNQQIPKVYIGMKVKMVTRLLKSDGDRGIRSYGYKFRPIIEGEISD